MRKNNIYFWDDPEEHKERNQFRKFLNNIGIATSMNIELAKQADIIFIHSSDSTLDLESQQDVFKIFFGSVKNAPKKIIPEMRLIEYVNIDYLIENQVTLIENLLNLNVLSLQSIYDNLFKLSSNLEDYLTKYFNQDFTLKDPSERILIKQNLLELANQEILKSEK